MTKLRTLLLSVLAASAAIPAIAAADTPRASSYDRRDRVHDRRDPRDYRATVRLAEVSADPRDGADRVNLDTRQRFARLELRAIAAPVELHRILIRFTSGRTLQPRGGVIGPGESLWIDLPRREGAIETIWLDYGDKHDRRFDRTRARLQIRGDHDRDRDRRYRPRSWGRW